MTSDMENLIDAMVDADVSVAIETGGLSDADSMDLDSSAILVGMQLMPEASISGNTMGTFSGQVAAAD